MKSCYLSPTVQLFLDLPISRMPMTTSSTHFLQRLLMYGRESHCLQERFAPRMETNTISIALCVLGLSRTISKTLSSQSAPELSLAKAKVSGLEKSLALRSKVISMQNARLSDLEKMLRGQVVETREFLSLRSYGCIPSTSGRIRK